MREVCCHMREVLASGTEVLGFWSGVQYGSVSSILRARERIRSSGCRWFGPSSPRYSVLTCRMRKEARAILGDQS